MGSEFSLAEGRVLYELAERGTARATDVGTTLGLDAGYLSRIVRQFLGAGLILRAAASGDGRAFDLRLSAKGRAAVRRLNSLADAQARSILEPMTGHQRERVTAAIQAFEATVLAPKQAQPVLLRAHRPGDMGTVVTLEGAGYAEQFGLDASFEALVARIVSDFLTNFDSACERCWIAEQNRQHVGHIFLVRHPQRPGCAKLRLLYVDPAARGTGLGRRLVAECVAFARGAGYKAIELWTQSNLLSARRIYQAAGFALMREEPHHSFGHDLVAQTWELKLQ
ncbi:MAG TPA: helix-turn-helix domain-containing GNAT family N-acetyltransferase [Terriglobales bacterium]|nr:helix-turn-helix domain-containing GNAT family N-acetyltransferase [Terriglobales bacterium]